MTAWDAMELDRDWYLVQNAFCTAFHNRALLANTIDWLAAKGYRIVQLNAADWSSREKLHRDFAEALNFPDYYGRNSHGLVDCLEDVAEADYGWDAAETGLVLVLDNYAAFHQADDTSANWVLDIIEDTGRLAALYGNRILCLVQSDDGQITFGPVGGRTVPWNQAEFYTSTRTGTA